MHFYCLKGRSQVFAGDEGQCVMLHLIPNSSSALYFITFQEEHAALILFGAGGGGIVALYSWNMLIRGVESYFYLFQSKYVTSMTFKY